ncbi:MAG: hypothetical protein ACYTXY_23470 [Nostoc sp.]
MPASSLLPALTNALPINDENLSQSLSLEIRYFPYSSLTNALAAIFTNIDSWNKGLTSKTVTKYGNESEKAI